MYLRLCHHFNICSCFRSVDFSYILLLVFDVVVVIVLRSVVVLT